MKNSSSNINQQSEYRGSDKVNDYFPNNIVSNRFSHHETFFTGFPLILTLVNPVFADTSLIDIDHRSYRRTA
jgi:hypothetical protein